MKKYFYSLFIIIILFISQTTFSLSGDEVLKKVIWKLKSSITIEGVISWVTSEGFTYTGSIKYKYPNKLYIKLTNPGGKSIITNGKKLWVVDKINNTCAIQEVSERTSSGLWFLTKDYNSIAFENPDGYTIKLKSDNKHYSEILIKTNKNYLIQHIVLTNKNGISTKFSFYNLKLNNNMPDIIFDFKPPSNVQTIINPLNIK